MIQNREDRRYDDMLDLPRPVSAKHPPMSRAERAAQFSPFKALTGYDDEVTEAARLTGGRIELDDASADMLNAKMQILRDEIQNHPQISITFFVPDAKKAGGEYMTVEGIVRRIDDVDRNLYLMDGTVIEIDEIIALDGEVFSILSPFE